ncbi:MAG TPA: tripartite tricarboxylate transporter substrate-binding protein [Crenalkalicoccus sp.]|nr:tripartite tricarboxylate transporter substrate-binding protein [Crenalkalicoccus sp.]
MNRRPLLAAGAAALLARPAAAQPRAIEARLPEAPAVPTIAELGVPGVAMTDWFALFAPAHLPAQTQDMLNTAANAVLAEPAVAQAFAGQRLSLVGGPPDRLRERLDADLPRWAEVVRQAGITPD